MKIVVFGASNSKKSINKRFASYASAFFHDDDIEILDLNDFALPVFSVDLQAENGIHENAIRFYHKLQSADLIIVSMAEHNGSYTAAFKNLLDWMSRYESKVFGNKPMLLLSTSPGGRGGKGVMDAALVRFPIHGAEIIAHFSLPKFNENFDDESGILNEDLRLAFIEVVHKVKTVVTPRFNTCSARL